MTDSSAFEMARDAFRALIPSRLRGDIPTVPVVRLAGVIGVSTPLKPGLTLASVARPLQRAFSMRGVRAVALAINSPGGSAAQSHLIFRRIRQLADEKRIPVFAFIEDVGASGGYMIACAADEIFCDSSSVVGSIGVVGGSFGFDKLLEKIGVERRLYTSGENKAMLDPFLPENPSDVRRLKAIQKDIHDDFIDLVKGRRGVRLDGREKDLFTGEYWAGKRALEFGLVDAIGDIRGVLRTRYGDTVKMPLIADRSFLGRRASGVSIGGLDAMLQPASLAEDVVSALEARAIWARFGI